MSNFAQGTCNNLYQKPSGEQVINYHVFKNDNKLLFVLIFQDQEGTILLILYSFPTIASVQRLLSPIIVLGISYLKKKKRLYFTLFVP